MRTSSGATACVLSPVLVLLLVTSCTCSVVTTVIPSEDSPTPTTSSADKTVATEIPAGDATEVPEVDVREVSETDPTEVPDFETTEVSPTDAREVPEVQPVVEEETTVSPLREVDAESSTPEPDIQVTDPPAILDVSLDAPGNFDSISEDVSRDAITLEVDDDEEEEEEVEDDTVSQKSDEVNYDGWTVLKVTGFKNQPVEDTEVEEDSTAAVVRLEDSTSEYSLLDLEERLGVRVLRMNRLAGFYEVAVSPAELEPLIKDLTARGLEVEDKNVNLGTMMDEATSPSLRQNLPKGEVTFDSYMTYEQIEDFILAFTEQNPHTVSRKVIGQTVEGRDIHMLTLSMGGRQCRSLKDESSSDEQGSQRESRQMKGVDNGDTPAVQQAMDALTRIIHWSDWREKEALRLRDQGESQTNHGQQQEETVTSLGQGNGGTPVKIDAPSQLDSEELTATHMLLEKIMQNIPYDYQFDSGSEENRTNKDTIRNTYDALQEIMSKDKVNSDDYVYLDSTDQPEAVQLTYKVLQRVINFNPNNPKQEPHQTRPFGAVFNRISKSVKGDDVNATEEGLSNNKTSTIDPDIEADILFLLSTFIPKEYAMNATIVESLKQSLIIISKLLPKDGNITQEVIDKLGPQIVNLPGVVGVSSDGSSTGDNLVMKLVNLLRTNHNVLRNSPSLDDEDRVQPSLRKSTCKPVIFLDGGIHAREWVSPAFLVYTLTQLVKNTPLLLGAEWRVVPVLNPDGYIHSWTKDRLWRKNKAKSSGCPGVDLNRNFGYKFGGAGTSTRKCSDIYRGTSAFSEPESKALKAAIEEVKDRLKAYVTVHSYGQMILHPWGHSKAAHPNDDQLKSMGDGMARAIENVYGTPYFVGSAARVLYPAAGGSDDWVVSIGVPYSFTMELRDEGRHGFVLPATLIKPTVVESWASIEYLGNRIINETPRSASPSLALTSDQVEQGSLFNTIGNTAPIPASVQQPVGVYPHAPLVPPTHGFGMQHAFASHAMPMHYSAAQAPVESIQNQAAREERPAAQSGPFQFAQSFNIPQTLQYYSQGYQPVQVQHPLVAATQVQAAQKIQQPGGGRPTFSDSLPNVSILENQQANVQLTPIGSVSQSSPYDFAFGQNQVQGNTHLLPFYQNTFYSPQVSSSNPYASHRLPQDSIGDGQIVNYLGQVLTSLYQNEALSSSSGSISPNNQQGYVQNYEGAYPVPFVVQNPYWNAPMPALTPLRQSVYSSGASSNPSYVGNSNVFIPYNSPMVVRPTTDFSENQQFPFPSQQFQNSPNSGFGENQQFPFRSQQFQNPEPTVPKFQPSTLAQFLNPEESSTSFSSPSPQFSQFRPVLPSPERANFKTDIDEVLRQNPNDYVEKQRLRHRLNAEYHKNSPVLVSLGNAYGDPDPNYSNRFDLVEGEIGELTPVMSYHRSIGRHQKRHQQRFEIPEEYRQ